MLPQTTTKRTGLGNRRRSTVTVIGQLCLPLLIVVLCPESRGADPDFDTDVARVLATHCLECHNTSEPRGKLDLSSRVSAQRGGEHGRAIIPGDPDQSRLWRRILANEMPPEKQLPAADKSIIRDWIRGGARWGSERIDRFQFSTDNRGGYDWWSLQRLQVIRPPAIADDTWSHNAVDRFIAARRAKANLQPALPANPRTLVRRLYFDLIGLPPPLEVIQSFQRNATQMAWTQLVDDLLDSPQYGERWAQHWLDVARFGETEGYEYNVPREHAWHYRDWVIRSLNADLPYDQFVRMQLAGDLLQPNSTEGAAAVGFLVAGVHNTVLGKSEVMRRTSRHEELQEMLGTTTQALLGLTVHCARCHDHKFDPISNREYYELLAALDGITHGTRKIGPRPGSQQTVAWTTKQTQLTQRLSNLARKRGGRLSRSVNAIRSAASLAAHTAGTTYTVTLKISPTVWADATQATTHPDGILLKLLRSNGSTLAETLLKPKTWTSGGNQQQFEERRFEYRGDGSGNLQLEISSLPATGRFGGAVDDLQIRDSRGRVLFDSNFNQLQHPSHRGTQAHTGLKIFWGMQSAQWKRSGVNTMHAVEHQPGNLAVQLFGGWPDTKFQPVTETEQQIADELQAITQRIRRQPVYTVVSREPGIMRMLQRGDPRHLGPEVGPSGLKAISGVPSTFGLAKTASDADRRLKLAEWITHRENGPFHRAIVNRIWHHHFGRGLVETTNDLGFNGGQPSHPELLDWLAIWFRDHRYSLKALHRLLVTSAAYQQSSLITDHPNAHAALRKDRHNRWLWRQESRRLDAETVRDSMLFIAGTLNSRPFGAGYRDVKIERVGSAHYYRAFDPLGDEFNRRTIYRWHARGERNSLLETFDCPDPSATTPTRNVTTTPNQALSHWNHSFVIRMSRQFADRVRREVEIKDSQGQALRAWQLALCREPDGDELKSAVELIDRHGLPLLCRVLLNCSESIVID